MRFTCGIIIGIILTLLCIGGICYYNYCRNNPDAPAESLRTVESSWQKTKETGDMIIEKARPYAEKTQTVEPPAPPELQVVPAVKHP